MKNPIVKIASILLCVLLLTGFSACEESPGSGGNSFIIGKVKIIEYNEDFTEVKATYYAQDEDVYLIFGDDETYSDDYSTTPDGRFIFEYLRKGKYKIYVYSEDSTGAYPSGDMPLYTEVEIAKNGSTVDMGEIVILKSSRLNSGTSSISGRVFAREYTPDFMVLLNQYYIFDEDVFLVQGNHTYYDDDVSTDVNGWYRFDRLPIGHYTIYAVSKDSTGTIPSGYYPVSREVDITSNFQDVVLDDLIIFKIN